MDKPPGREGRPQSDLAENQNANEQQGSPPPAGEGRGPQPEKGQQCAGGQDQEERVESRQRSGAMTEQAPDDRYHQ